MDVRSLLDSATMPAVLRFRTTWGIEPGPNLENWAKWFLSVKAEGFDGIEVEPHVVREDLDLLRRLCADSGLKISTLIYSGWPGYQGPRPKATVEDHLDHYRKQVEIAKRLAPVRINCHSGFDYWSIDQSVIFFKGTLSIDSELGVQGLVCHETHRNRALYNPYATVDILGQVPDLRITADISHHVVVCERLLDAGEEDRQLLAKIAPHVYHIHARIGTTQASQCPDPTNPVFTAERTFFENFWKQCIDIMRDTHDPSNPITFVPEYGPYPYHPIQSTREFFEVANTEGARLQKLFEQWAQK